MDEKTLRFQCLQVAQNLLQYTGQPGSAPPTSDAVLTLAGKIYSWVSTGTAA